MKVSILGTDYEIIRVDDGQDEFMDKNEEMIDWFAIQSPRMFEAFKAADCL